MIVLILLLLILFVGMRWLFAVVTVEGNSMLPHVPPGSRFIIVRQFLKSQLRHQRLVVFTDPDAETTSAFLIKRIIGLPGDVITSQTTAAWTVPTDAVFVRSDDIERGRDSRHFGAVPYQDILGIVIIKF